MNILNATVLLLLASANAAFAQSAPAPSAPQPSANGAPQNPPPPPARGPALDLTVEAAQAAIEAGRAADQKVAVSVIDSAGVLKAVLVSDGVGPRALQNSNFKAQAALAFKESSGVLAEQVKNDSALGDKVAANPNYLPRAGAVLIKVNDEIIGVIGVAHERDKPYFEKASSEPHTLRPDRLSQSRKAAKFETYADKYTLSDGARAIEIHRIAGSGHSDDLALVYLPKEKVLIEADAYTPLAADAPPPKTPNPYSVNLHENIVKLGLEPALMVAKPQF
jgi:uncharacterized protein GlcG (DUF336 family)